MPTYPGRIVLMGSGELTGTMVELHKHLLQPYGSKARAVFIDTPAGFQLNVDQISQKAAEYFQTRVQHSLLVASFKSADPANTFEAEQTYRRIREADYILIGPGSPTYAVDQWKHSAIAGLLIDRIESGGCLVAASAAALTVGRLTLPVYEIYKVGQPLHWTEGIDILGHFGLNLVVVPHWNNAEGGNHDTRFCFMGAERFDRLQSLLPESSAVLGIDEHTALIIDLNDQRATVKGIGRVTLRRGRQERILIKGDSVPLSVLHGEFIDQGPLRPEAGTGPSPAEDQPQDALVWKRLHALESDFADRLEKNRIEQAVTALLELESSIWNSQQALQENESMGAARELLREMIVLFGHKAAGMPASRQACIAALVDALIQLRARLRQRKQWSEADAVRDCLKAADVVLEDTPEGPRWYIL
jgi:peptidase E